MIPKISRSLTIIVLLVLVAITASTVHTGRATPLTTRLPISIIGNSGFTPANGITAGSGSTSNPFIIEGWNISTTNTDGIHIEQTNASFIIRNVNIHGQGQSNGIFLLDVTNGVIDNATITTSYDGITITLSNATIENSQITTNTEYGIRILDGENVNLYNNTLTQEKAAIYGESCVRCALNITRNMVNANLAGIVLHSLNNTFIFENTISSNQNDGIGAYKSTYVSVVLNNITSNGLGVNLGGSTQSLVHHNNFVSNSIQALDNETGQNRWDVGYASGGNYWSDYRGVDNCSGAAQNICPRPDGIGDTAYNFAEAQDRYPLMKPFVQTIIHDVAVTGITPSTTSVNQNQTLSITVKVRNEGAAIENFTLTLYYDTTSIGNQTIPPMAPGASQTVLFSWNTTGVAVGAYTLKAVATTVWGEIDVADNTLVTGPVIIKAPQSSTPTPPNSPPTPQPSTSPYPYIIGGIVAFFILSSLAIITRKRKHRTSRR